MTNVLVIMFINNDMFHKDYNIDIIPRITNEDFEGLIETGTVHLRILSRLVSEIAYLDENNAMRVLNRDSCYYN